MVMVRDMILGETGWSVQDDCMVRLVRGTDGNPYLARIEGYPVDGTRDVHVDDDGAITIEDDDA